jgi:hypothetical protein
MDRYIYVELVRTSMKIGEGKKQLQNKIAKHQRAEILLTNLMLNNNRIN